MLSLALRGLRFHWRSHVGLFLGATIATAIIVGALAVGDSVRQSLRNMAIARLGSIQLALNGQSRFVRSDLAKSLKSEIDAPTAAVLILRGTAVSQKGDEDRRSGQIQIVGVEDEFWGLASSRAASLPPSHAAINRPLAEKLGLAERDEILLRIEKPSLLSRDAPLSTVDDTSVTLRLPIASIVDDSKGGRFSLAANQLPPMTAFVPLSTLQNRVGLKDRANVILVGDAEGKRNSSQATQALWKHWDFADAGLVAKSVRKGKRVELSTDRVFLDPPVGNAAIRAMPGAEGVLTYFVNEIRVRDRTTPYSVVSGMQGGPLPPDLQDDEILLNEWLANDLQAKPGDSVKLTYWVVGPMRRLETRTSTFRVRSIVPITGAAADPDLMPNIPGLSDKKNCREWDPGVPIELAKIRDKDQEYWSKYRGTPKAFITLGAAQRAWKNRFGSLTAVRYPADSAGSQSIETCIHQALNPAALGIYFAPVREQALAATSTALDFGQLFVAFSFFLILASLLLTALLFGFAVEQRSEEVGALLALGFRPGWVRRLLLLESVPTTLLAAFAGSLLGVLYTRFIVNALNTVWRGAVSGAGLVYSIEPKTMAIGALSGFLTAMFAAWLVMRRQARAPIRELLSQASSGLSGARRSSKRRILPGVPTAIVTGLMGAGALAASRSQSESEAAETFFIGGMFLLIAGLSACRAIFAVLSRRTSRANLTIPSLGTRGTTRRVGRSLAAVALLASGTFLVVAVGAGRHDPTADSHLRKSGTGGFTLYGESSLPVFSDLNSEKGREDYSLAPEELEGVQIVQMRLRDGDEASCLNLNRAIAPRLLGVNPSELRTRKAFTFSSLKDDKLRDDPWRALETPSSDGAIPAVGDANTVTWSMGKGLGDVVPYVDDRGATRKLRIVGILANSVLQGALIVNEADFVQMFSSVAGYQVFLIDAPKAKVPSVEKELSRALEDQGLSLTPAPARLAAFATVEATYLSIFAALGGLGLLLGSAGLGVIVLRNVLERRGELALLRAVGFQREALHRLVFSEHTLLLVLGLAVGVAAAIAAVIPTLRAEGFAPVAGVGKTLVAVLISGLLWTWLATVAALRGPLLTALRNE
jgi:putative ABC transport system permease protein